MDTEEIENKELRKVLWDAGITVGKMDSVVNALIKAGYAAPVKEDKSNVEELKRRLAKEGAVKELDTRDAYAVEWTVGQIEGNVDIIKYLIENDQEEWYFPSLEMWEHSSVHGTRERNCMWVKDANKAMQYDSFEKAKEAMELADDIHIPCKVTEHIFSSPSKSNAVEWTVAAIAGERKFEWTDELVKRMIFQKLPIPEHYISNLQKCLDEFKNSIGERKE